MLNIDSRCFNAAVFFSLGTDHGLIEVGLRRVWVRSATMFVAASSKYIFGKDSLLGITPLFLRFSLPISW